MSNDDVVTVSIDRVGAEGDGIATAPDGATLYIPDVLPGELVTVARQQQRGDGWFAALSDVLRASEKGRGAT